MCDVWPCVSAQIPGSELPHRVDGRVKPGQDVVISDPEATTRATSTVTYGRVQGQALEPFALQALALHLPRAADGFSSLAGSALRRLLEVAAQLHLAKNTLALHLLLERLQRLVDIVVTNENLHLAAYSFDPNR